jgi:TPP-dependent pyruvate/acetoin dehydrogenase alpha subunit
MAAPPLGGEQALHLLATMWRIRLFEERVGRLKRADEVHGLIHLSVGQEGVAAAVCTQLRDDDAVYSGHRAHGHAIAKGAPLDRTLAELMGRDGGLCRGLGGSMHLVDVEHGFMGATGVVGGNVPIALGSALAARMRGDDSVAVVFFGDGAVQAGHFNETVNLATLWQLPMILVCENNGFAEFTPRSAHTNVERVSDVVAPYELERETVDGNDAVAVWEAFGGYLAAARKGGGPFLLECLTYRSGATTRATRPRTARRSPPPSGRRRIRSCASSATGSPRAGSPRGVAGDRGRRRRGARGGRRASPGEPVPAGRAARGARLRAMPEVTYIKAITATLAEAMRADERVFVLGEDVAEGGPYTATAGLAEEFGTARVINTPISEAAITGVAIGAAQSGCGRCSRSCSSTSSRSRSTSS